MEQLTIAKVGNREIVIKAKKLANYFAVTPNIHIEHRTAVGFAIVIGWLHYIAGISFFRID